MNITIKEFIRVLEKYDQDNNVLISADAEEYFKALESLEKYEMKLTVQLYFIYKGE